MSGPTAPPPPPSAYPAAYAPAQPAPTPVKLPGGITLWDLIGFVIILVGAILILVGFLEGDAAIGQLTATPPSETNYANDLQGFFVWTGVGIFLTILGWLLRVMVFPMMAARKQAAPSAMAPAPAMAPAAAPPMAPAAVPATPVCPKCGKPTTYIAQYGRYYCYTDAVYV